MNRIRVCFKIKGLAMDTDGKPCAAGMCIDLGETDKDIEYEKLTSNLNIPAVLKMAMLDEDVDSNDVEIITPEEYDRQYGDDTDEGDVEEWNTQQNV